MFNRSEGSPQASPLEATDRAVLSASVSEFLFHEARLLDEWRLDEWLTLFTPEARYVVPTTDGAEGSPRDTLFLVDDDVARLGARVERLKSRWAHREFPWSRTRRIVANIELIGRNGSDVRVDANFLVYRFRRSADCFVGTYRHVLREVDGEFRFVQRRAVLDLEALDPHGTMSIII